MMEKKACLTRPSATTLCPFPGVEPRWTLILLDPARDQEEGQLGFCDLRASQNVVEGRAAQLPDRSGGPGQVAVAEVTAELVESSSQLLACTYQVRIHETPASSVPIIARFTASRASHQGFLASVPQEPSFVIFLGRLG